jgi:hypothetical protein
VQFHSIDSLRLLACLPLVGVVVQMTRHCSNLASAVHKTLCRRRFQCKSQFVDGGRLLAAVSRIMTYNFRNIVIGTLLPTATATPVALSSKLSCQFYRNSIALFTSLLHLHCITPLYAFPTFNTLLLQPDCAKYFFFCLLMNFVHWP